VFKVVLKPLISDNKTKCLYIKNASIYTEMANKNDTKGAKIGDKSLEDILSRTRNNFLRNIGEVSNTPLVGRETELATAYKQAESCLCEKSKDSTPILLVKGEAGAGKTRFVKELVDKYPNAIILNGRCIDEGSSAYHPFINAFRDYCNIGPSDNDEAEAEKVSKSLLGDLAETTASEGLETVAITGATALVGIATAGIGIPIAVGLGLGGKKLKKWYKNKKDKEEKVENIVEAKIDPERKQELMQEFFYKSLKAISKKRPVVLFLDDLQWMDKSSLDALHYAARNLRNEQVFIIGTYREEEAHLNTAFKDFEQKASRENLYTEMRLAKLGSSEGEEMIRKLFAQNKIPENAYSENVPKYIIGKTQGNPLFIEEIVKEIADNYKANEKKILTKNIHVPARVEKVIERRIGKLDNKTNDVLKYASVIGHKFDYKTLSESMKGGQGKVISMLKDLGVEYDASKPLTYESITQMIAKQPEKAGGFALVLAEMAKGQQEGMSENDLNAIINNLSERKLIKEVDKENHIYSFDHGLIRETVYNKKFSGTEREQVHNKVGDALEQLNKDELNEVYDQLARHYYKGNSQADKAIKYNVAAGKQAHEVRHGHDEALKYYEQALEFLDTSKNGKSPPGKDKAVITRERVPILADAARIAEIAAQWDKAIAWNEEIISALKDSPSREDQLMVADALRSSGKINSMNEKNDIAREKFNTSLAISESLGDELGSAKTQVRLGWLDYTIGRYDDAIKRYESAIEISSKLNENYLQGEALNNLSSAFTNKGEFEKAEETLQQSISILTNILSRELFKAQNGLGVLYQNKSDYQTASKYFKKALDIANKLNSKRSLEYALSNLSDAYARNGNVAEAIKYNTECIETAKKLNDQYILSCTHQVSGIIYTKTKEFDKAESEFNKAITMIKEQNRPYNLADFYSDFGKMYKAKGDNENARKYLTDARDIFQKIGAKDYLAKTEKELESIEQKAN